MLPYIVSELVGIFADSCFYAVSSAEGVGVLKEE